MIKRISRNFKVPLVTGGQWKDHQSFQKWDPINKRLVTVNCCLPEKCFQPQPVMNVTMTNMVGGSAVVSWNYPDNNVSFEVNIYEGTTSNVDTSGTPKYSVLGVLSGSTIYFSNISNYYYVASVRVRNKCLFSSYVYSLPVQYVFTGYSYIVNTDASISGRININPYHYPLVYVNINKFDSSGNNLSSWLLGTVSVASYIKIQKDINNYVLVSRSTSTDMGSYWNFDCTVFSSSGSVNIGDTVTITTTA